jgi:hypothetical protein
MIQGLELRHGLRMWGRAAVLNRIDHTVDEAACLAVTGEAVCAQGARGRRP